jgi:hypothetical protein
MKNKREESASTVERELNAYPLSADDEASSTTAVAPVQQGEGVNGRTMTSSMSMSSHSRETTPSSSLGGQAVDIAPFTEFFKKQREEGEVSKELRDEAMKILREWRSEWFVEDKRIRELKRKIKLLNNTATMDVPPSPPTPTEPNKSRGRAVSHGPIGNGNIKVVTELPQKRSVSKEADSSKATSPGSGGGRRDSITGPNGLTGSYWDISISEMGRGNRRKTRA